MPNPTPNVPRNLRTEYTLDQLDERDVLPDGIAQFERWFRDAQAANLAEPNAMTVATADASGAPSARVCLLKGLDQRGFVFYTNYDSRKGRELGANPRVALCFYWQPLERQVRVEGFVEKVGREQSEAYFRTRPTGSQIGAWVSHQSETIGSRAELDQRAAELMAKYKGGPIPLPPTWGGYRVIPQVIEFWQGRPNRLHDRLRYTRESSGAWSIQRLAP